MWLTGATHSHYLLLYGVKLNVIFLNQAANISLAVPLQRRVSGEDTFVFELLWVLNFVFKHNLGGSG